MDSKESVFILIKIKKKLTEDKYLYIYTHNKYITLSEEKILDAGTSTFLQ